MMMTMNLNFILLFVSIIIFQIDFNYAMNIPGLYDPVKDDVEILNATSFNSIYNSDRAAFVEFYAHWCGACQRYAQHWKEIAKQTKSWQKKVIRVAAINCADQVNDPLCRDFNIEYYPTLKLFPAKSVKGIQPESFRSDKVESLINKMILFIENHEHKSTSWPELEPYTSKRLDTLFLSPYSNCKYAFLIFEKSDTDEFGRKLILDFSEFTDRIAIRRVVSNPSLNSKFGIVDNNKKPFIYLINNTHSGKGSAMKSFEKFDQKLVDRYAKNLGQFTIIKDDDENIKSYDDRQIYSNMIRKFIKITDLLSKAELEHLNQNQNAAQIHAEELNKAEAQSYLTNMDNRIFMQDLESGLHLMLRNDIPRFKLITGEKMKALKDWIRILVKYFPARKPVRLYLKQLYLKINDTVELSGNQWKLLADDTNLPSTVEWRHCKGSELKYRGYPCSLWTLFHVLTVSQTEIEKTKPRPFENEFNISEVIESIRMFVFNFFTCTECANNFRTETENYIRYLSKPYDAVQYLWTIHNSVNKRLKTDISTDPLHPKQLFPSKSQCPKCYLPNINVENLADHESPWITNEVLLFLTSFYSKYQIEGIRELDEKGFVNKTINDQLAIKSYDYEADDNIGKNLLITKRQSKRLNSIHLEQQQLQQIPENIFDIKFNIFIVFLFISILAVFYSYFNFKRKFKLKKHII